MNWFAGNIAEAVNVSKTQNAIFVVYCEGTDELSQNLSKLINDERVSSILRTDKFVAIKIQGDSESYIQFAQIYKLVPLPSLFFIGKNGTPIEVVTGVTKTVDELESKVIEILKKSGLAVPETARSSATQGLSSNGAPGASSQADDDTEIVCEGDVCRRVPKKPTSADGQTDDSQLAGGESDVSHEEKLRRAKELIELKRKRKEEEENRLQRERELQRRRAGQDLQNFKQRQVEIDIKKQQEERKRDRLEEQSVRQRILEQIAQDKAERAQKNNQAPPSPVEKNAKPEVVPFAAFTSTNKAEAKIQFRKPDGETEVQVFPSSELFETVRTFVEENVIVGSGIREFALATTFPKKEFKADDNAKTLLELNLAPTSVILILPLDKVSSRALPLQTDGIFTIMSTIFWGIWNPLFAAILQGKTFIWSKINNLSGFRGAGAGERKRASDSSPPTLSPNDAAKRRTLNALDKQPVAGPSNTFNKPAAYRRVGGSNVHRLNENQDSDDENNTWNGNSTQQQ